MRHIRSPQADLDLDSIWYYLASESGNVEIADRVIDSITGRFLLLAVDLRPGLRSIPVGEYIIIYRIQDEDVVILRVLRGSRNIEALLGQ